MSILLGMISLAMMCMFVLISARFSITEYNKSHAEVEQEKASEDNYDYLFSVYKKTKISKK